MVRVGLVVAILGTAVLGGVSSAAACTEPDCWQGAFVPGDGATIPANAPALGFRPSNGGGEPMADLELFRILGGGEGAIALEPVGYTTEPMRERGMLAVRPDGLAPGAYLARWSGCDGPMESQFFVGAEAPLPSALGTLAVTGRRAGELSGCGESARVAYADALVELDETARPWDALLRWETLVNGRAFASHGVDREDLRASDDRVYAVCDSEDEGLHRIRRAARLPGATGVLETNEVEVTISCQVLPPPPLPPEEPEAETVPVPRPELESPPGATPAETLVPVGGGVCSAGGARGAGATPWLLFVVGTAVLSACRRGAGRSRR